jgi:DNA anti-recombination protein RmuC
MNINKQFSNLLLLSLSGILGVTVAAHFGMIRGLAHPFLAFAFGMLPMFYWHYMLSTNEDLNQTQIDTIYFFGFLVTLVTLGCAATFALTPNKQELQITIIAYQFSLGLLATGYGLLARVLLTNRRVTVAGTDDAIDLYLQKIGRVLVRFEETVALFDRLRDDVVTKAQDGATAISQQTISILESELRAPLENLKSLLSGISNELSSMQASDNLRRLNAELGKTINGLEGASAMLGPLAEGAAAANEQMSKASVLHESFSAKLNDASASIVNFKQEANSLTISVKQINEDFSNISRSTQQLVNDFSEIDAKDVTQALGTIATSFKSLLTTLNKTNAGFESLESSVQAMSGAMSTATGSLKDGFSQEINLVGQQLRSITENLSAFSKGFQDATIELDGMKNSISQLLNQTNEFGKNDILGLVQKVITELSPLVAGTQSSITGVNSLIKNIEEAQQKMKPLAAAAANEIGMLSQDLQLSAKALGTAMTTLAGSVKRAAEELSGS